jgi:NTE family protein
MSSMIDEQDETPRADLTRRSLLAGLATAGAATSLAAGATQVAAADQPNRKLLLGGGGIRGAYEAGAVARLFSMGFAPNAIYGVSVGALNAGFLCDRASFLGKPRKEYYATLKRPVPKSGADGTVDWAFIGRELIAFWKENITGSGSLIRRRRGAAFFSALFGSFNGLLEVSPLRTLVKNNLDIKRMRNGVPLSVAAVNIDTGVTEYFSEDDDFILEAIVASAAVPVLMPFVELSPKEGKGRYCDGGLREILPTGLATKPVPGKVATHLVSIVCQPLRRDYGVLANPGNVIQLILRYSDIAAEEIVKNDLDVLRSSPIKKIVIRPSLPVNIDKDTKKLFDLDQFTPAQIADLIDKGAWYAKDTLEKPESRFVEDGFKSA